MDGLEKERDFYFGKLRDIELICQEMEEQHNVPLIQKVLDILYATEVSYYIALYLHSFFYYWPISKPTFNSCSSFKKETSFTVLSFSIK